MSENKKPQATGSQHKPMDGLERAVGPTVINSIEDVNKDFASQLSVIRKYYTDNQEAYTGSRAQAYINPKDLRIISDVGYYELFNPKFDIYSKSKPTFRYVPPFPYPSMTPFKEGVKFVVMHSTGREQAKGHVQKNRPNYYQGLDPETYFSPLVYTRAITQLTTKNTEEKAIHHIVSRRGDITCSLGWDTKCWHGGAGEGSTPIQGVNNASIGIEHEESWQPNPLNYRAEPRSILDQRPYTEEQFLADAFILKKLESYTGNSFNRYLGFGDELKSNFYNNVTGCFNHNAIRLGSGAVHHDDPSAQYNFPPEYVLWKTDLSTIPVVKDNVKKWNDWLTIWYSDVTDPSRVNISAYARIFSKMARIRADAQGNSRGYDLQTEVFDNSLRDQRIAITVPAVRGAHAVALAQGAMQDRLNATQRAQRMASQTRASLYDKARQTAATAEAIWSGQAATLAQIEGKGANAPPIIEDRLSFDSNTGQWSNEKG